LVDIAFDPLLHLRFREDIFTYILRIVDLNFAYTDYLEDKFNFKNDEEYFRSTEYLLKSRTIIKTDFLALSLFKKQGEQLTELGMKKPVIKIDYHLNRRHNYEIFVEEMNSFFIDGEGQKKILFGNINERHWIESFEDMRYCLEVERQNPSKILINISMYPDGNKYFHIQFSGLKLFLHPYFYLMMDHFFRENQPIYDTRSKDQPNEYSEDYEIYPEIHSIFKLENSIICHAACDNPESSSLGIGC
jgi:hypothetical protein